MMSLALLLGSIAVMYFSFRPDINFLRVKQAFVNDTLWRTSFYVHISGGILAIVAGPLQFLKWIRKRNVKVHRTIGKVYVVAILVIGAPAGFYMALFANGGPWASTGFAVMAMLWFYTTWTAYRFIRVHDLREHRRWMIRSYALTFSAVTLRLWVPLCSIWLHMNHDSIIVLSAWTSWGINLVLAELFLLLDSRFKLRIAT
jgi:uncharacterized membrane protein